MRCLKHAKANDDVVVPVVSQKPKRSNASDKSDVQQDFRVNWCAQDMWSKGKLERMWVEELKTSICPTHLNYMTVEDLKDVRPLRDKCGGCDTTGPKIHIILRWEPRARRWLCRTCFAGRPAKPEICQTSWCSREAQVWREDNKTWTCTSCKYSNLSAINENRSLHVKTEDCGTKDRGKFKLFRQEERHQWLCKASSLYPPCKDIAIEMHSTFKEQSNVHGEVIMSCFCGRASISKDTVHSNSMHIHILLP